TTTRLTRQSASVPPRAPILSLTPPWTADTCSPSKHKTARTAAGWARLVPRYGAHTASIGFLKTDANGGLVDFGMNWSSNVTDGNFIPTGEFAYVQLIKETVKATLRTPIDGHTQLVHPQNGILGLDNFFPTWGPWSTT